jgi:hypothetical protein
MSPPRDYIHETLGDDDPGPFDPDALDRDQFGDPERQWCDAIAPGTTGDPNDDMSDFPLVRDAGNCHAEDPGAFDERDYGFDAGTRSGDKSKKPIGDIPLTVEEWLARVLPDLDRIMGEWFFTTSRTLLIGPTGVGKTNFSRAIAGRSAIGRNFLHWRAYRPSRILYIDGEMSARLFKQRLADLVRRLGEIPTTLFPFSHGGH